MELTYTTHSLPRVRTRHSAAAWVLFLLPALACTFVALTPSIDLLPGVRSLYDSKRLLEIGLLAAAALGVALVPGVRAAWLRQFAAVPRIARWGLALVLGLGLASALLAPVTRYAMLSVGHYTLLFVFAGAVAVARERYGVRFDRVVVGTLALCALLYAVSFAVGYGLHLVDGEVPIWPEGHTGFANKRFFNQFQTWTLPLLVLPALLVPLRARWARGGLLGLAAFWWMLLFASGGRGTTVGIALALVGVALIFRRRAARWLRAHLLAMGAGAAGYLLLFKVFSSTGASLAGRGLDGGGRLENWQAALALTADQPWLGLGPMHTAYLPNRLWPTTHNAPLQFAAEWGVPAAVLLVALAVWGLTAWIRQRRTEAADAQPSDGRKRLVRVALTGSILAAGAHAMVSGVVVMPLSQVMMALVLGWAWAVYRKQRTRTHAPAAGARRRDDLQPAAMNHYALAALAVAAVGVVLWASYPEALYTDLMKLHWMLETQNGWLAPRFWHQGIFGY